MAWDKISFILLNKRLESTLNIDLVFRELMPLHKLLLGFPSFVVQILPYWFDIILVFVMHSFWGTVLMRGGSSEFLLSIFLRGQHDLVIGLKVFLLIKIHLFILFYFIRWLLYKFFVKIGRKNNHLKCTLNI